ncbi:MAG: NTP transferase domain-containing protein [Phycisphaerales bacterium]|nr:NTP transferase domain-containing protein [Phycisphaerales bacterium]
MPSHPSNPSVHAPSAIILAAGMGKRMQSDLPKVLHPIGGRPMVRAVIDACRGAGCKRIVLIVGHKQELVREAIRAGRDEAGIEFAVQSPQLGTGHAVRCAEDLFANEKSGPGHPVFVLAGDGPLIRAQTLRELLDRHRSTGAQATLATSVIDDPTGYGRIVRDASGAFTGIVEHKEATDAQRAIREVNPSYYCFDAVAMFDALSRVKRQESNGEYYITDVPSLLLATGRRVEVVAAVPPEDVLSINTLEQLAEVDAIYRSRQPRKDAHA